MIAGATPLASGSARTIRAPPAMSSSSKSTVIKAKITIYYMTINK